MSNAKTVDDFNNEKLKELLKERKITRRKMAMDLGVSECHFDRICDGGKKPSLPLFKLLCMTLEVNEDAFKKEVQAPATQPAQSQIGMIMDMTENTQKIERLSNQIIQMERDMARLSAVIMDIQRTVKETKAETELVRGDLNSCFEKLTTVSSNTGKIYGKLKAMEK